MRNLWTALVCIFSHARYWQFRKEGDWQHVTCDKCGVVWTEPRT